MESASDGEGEVRRAGQMGTRGDVAGEDASGFTSPAEARDNGEDEGDVEGGPGRPGRKRSRAVQGTIQGCRGGRQQGRLEPCRPRRASG
jgi:hypothetical protein